MLHNEARKLLVEGYEATHNAEAIAKIFHVNKYTVYHLEERKRKTGSVDLQTWRRGRKALLSSTDKARIAEYITKNPTINLEELRTQLGLKVSISTMSRVVRALGFRVKKVGLSATERECPRCAGKTYQVKKLKLAIGHCMLVFLDESGVNIGRTRRHGRVIGKARVHGSAPLNVTTSQTVLASVRLNGQITYTMYPGGTRTFSGLSEKRDHSHAPQRRHRCHGQHAFTPCQGRGRSAACSGHDSTLSATIQPGFESD